MSTVDVSIELPESPKPGELMKSYFTLMRSFGWDLYITCHFSLKDEWGSGWFAARIAHLKANRPKGWNPNHKFDPQDPVTLLRDYAFEYDSPYRDIFGDAFPKIAAAKKILSTRNVWFHFGDDPSLEELREVAGVVHGFVVSSGMHIAPRIERLIDRLNAVRTGRYPESPAREASAPAPSTSPESAHPGASTPDGPEGPDLDTLASADDLPRPNIGGTWLGAIPTERYLLTPTGDALHPDTMRSIRERVTGDFAEKLRRWTAVPPRGGELWVDADGAVGGFVGPTPRLLGYLGDDPTDQIARGFFTPHYYGVEGSDVVDLDSRERRPLPGGASGVPEGAVLRVTTYGDLLIVEGGADIERVAVLEPSDWFAGHLTMGRHGA